jgi:hypothetical protein
MSSLVICICMHACSFRIRVACLHLITAPSVNASTRINRTQEIRGFLLSIDHLCPISSPRDSCAELGRLGQEIPAVCTSYLDKQFMSLSAGHTERSHAQ